MTAVHSLCENCGEPVHEEGRAWLHTDTGLFGCGAWKGHDYRGEPEFAQAAGEVSVIIEKAWREGYDFAYEEMTDAKSAEKQESK